MRPSCSTYVCVSGRAREGECVFVCVCVYIPGSATADRWRGPRRRAREGVCVRVCVCVCVCVCVYQVVLLRTDYGPRPRYAEPCNDL
jgi:hypothetical protein